MQESKKYNFENPEIQAKAVELAKVAERPTSYNTPKKMALELKREIMKETINQKPRGRAPRYELVE